MGWREFLGLTPLEEPQTWTEEQLAKGYEELAQDPEFLGYQVYTQPEPEVPKLKFLTATVTSVNPFVEGEVVAVGHRYKYGCVETTLAWIEPLREGSPEVLPNTQEWADVEALVQTKANILKSQEQVRELQELKEELKKEVTSLKQDVEELEKRKAHQVLPPIVQRPTPSGQAALTTSDGSKFNKPGVKRSSLEDEYGMGASSVPAPETGVDMFDAELDPNSQAVAEEDITSAAAAFLSGATSTPATSEEVGFVPIRGMRVVETDTDLAGVVQSIEDDVAVVLMEDRPEMLHIPFDGLRAG